MSIRFLYLFQFIGAAIEVAFGSILAFISPDLGLSLSQTGIIKSIFNIIKIIFVFPVIYLANKYSNRSLLIFSVILFSFSFILYAFSNSFIYLAIVTVVCSLGLTIRTPIGKAELAALSKGPNRGKVTGNYQTLGEFGKLLLSSLLGFTLLITGWRISILIFGILILIVILISVFKLIREKYVDSDISSGKLDLGLLKHNKRMRYAIMCSLLDNIASSSLLVFIPFYLLFMGFEPIFIPTVSAVMLIGNIMGKFFIGRLSDKMPPAKVFIISEILMAILLLVFLSSQSIILILLVSLMLGVVTKGTVPVYQVMVANANDEHGNYKTAFGMETISNNIGAFIAASLFGYIGEVYSLPVVFIGFAITALIAVLPGLAYHIENKRILKYK
jgi:predicted MFS family arabinose efflux permease